MICLNFILGKVPKNAKVCIFNFQGIPPNPSLDPNLFYFFNLKPYVMLKRRLKIEKWKIRMGDTPGLAYFFDLKSISGIPLGPVYVPWE